MRYKMTLAYKGTAYSGFQIQHKKHTIQAVMESALHKILSEDTSLITSGRTDSGVHALCQTVHFDLKTKKAIERMRSDKILYQLNSVLPDDILITKVNRVKDDFHARSFDQKTYRYHIVISRFENPFLRDYTWQIPKPLDVAAIKSACRHLVGKHNFTSFCASDSTTKTKTRELLSIKIHHKSPAPFLSFKHEKFITLDFTGRGFLKQMVRNLVGTLVAVGQNKISPDDVKAILKAQDRKRAFQTAPAQGLFQIQTKYL